MSENSINTSGVNEAVCIDTGRVYDSCMDRDCIENVRVYFSEEGQRAIQNAISAKENALKEIGITKEELLDRMIGADHIYISEDFDEEILVFYEEVNSIPYEFYTAPERIELQKETQSEYEEMGFKVVQAGIEDGVDADFVFVEIGETEEHYPMLVYNTVHNGIYIEIIYIYYGDEEIDRWDADALVSYTEFYGEAQYIKNNYPAEYTFSETGTKITVPGGWCITSKSENDIIAIKSKNVMMAYFSYDSWEKELTEEDRSLTKRSDYNMELFTDEDLKEIIESIKED